MRSGDVYYAQADYWHGISPRFSSYQWIRQKQYAGGAMITGGSHATDIIRYLHGEVAEVHAFATKARDDFDYLTTFVAAVRFVDGSVGKLSASLDGVASPYQFNIDLLGTRGVVPRQPFLCKGSVSLSGRLDGVRFDHAQLRRRGSSSVQGRVQRPD